VSSDPERARLARFGLSVASFVRSLSLKAASLALERGARLGVTLVAAPLLGANAFGRFVFASTLTAILALGADLGLGLWTTRAIARGDCDDRDIVRTALSMRALAAAVCVLVVGIIVALSPDTEMRLVLSGLSVAALLGGFIDHFAAILRGAERFADETRLNLVRAVLTAGLGAVALCLFPSLAGLTGALAFASVGAFAYGGIVALSRYHVGGPPRPWDRDLARKALRESLPIWVAGLVSLLYFKVDTFFVKGFWGDGELGAYGAAYKVLEGAMLVPSAVVAVTFPRLVRVQGDARVRTRLEVAVAGLLLFSALAIGLCVVALARPIVTVFFGATFLRGEDSLRVLAWGIPLIFVNYALTHYVIARGRERVNTGLSVMMLAVTLALDAWLIPRGGGPGAARATVLSEVFLTVGCLVALWPRPRARPRP
jgi:polysaccharide transporter, PST family